MESMSKSDGRRSASSTLSIVAGSIMVASGLVAVAMMTTWSSLGGMMGYGMGGMMGGWGMMSPSLMFGAVAAVSAFTVGLGVVLVVGGYAIHKSPKSAGAWGTAILVVSVIGLIGMSGFFIGPVIGIIAGILALTKR